MFDMLGNYDARKVGRFDNDDGTVMVSTAKVTDAPSPFETAVAHPHYNDGKIVIVAYYEDKESAEKGHTQWVEKMTASELPDQLVDISDIFVTQMMDELEDSDWRTMPNTGGK